MGNWHLDDLRNALEARGWRIIAEHPGDDHSVSGTWEIQRSTRRPAILIDFAGLDDLRCSPMPQSYACKVRGMPDIVGLYFYRQRSRHIWHTELREFMAQLDAFYTYREANNVDDAQGRHSTEEMPE